MEYTDTEQRILDMWPKYEDGSYVMYEDKFEFDGEVKTAYGFNFGVGGRVSICSDKGLHVRLPNGERVKRPAPKVLDADGVEIKVGDTVWFRSLSTGARMRKATVTGFGEHSMDGPLATLEDEAGKTWYIDPKKITHVQPDSWERLERDADNGPCGYFDFNGKECTGCPAYGSGKTCIAAVCTDLIRRAKALAEKEAVR